uniref:ATP synthase F0 subunit 8 n=1 Tax=Batophila aerata TaxID=877817 RepID=A0A3G1GRI1_9CUCU|nr:ATP synthase F0 subunit 8 [Batophila aerata]
MPQMMPLNWISLMFYFISIFFMFNNMIYYLYMSKNTETCNSFKLKLNWKW